MTKQEVFDVVAAHLLKQNRKATAGNGSSRCLFKTPDGLKCAVGCLIKDENYTIQLEDRGIKTLIDMGLVPDHEVLLISLQEIHDQYYSILARNLP